MNTTHEEMVAALTAKLPATKCCPKCHQTKPIEAGFGLRTSYKGDRAVRVQVQSQCRMCRSGKAPVVATNKVLVERMSKLSTVQTWEDAVLVALGGSQAVKLADLYTTIQGMGAMASKLASNSNWKAKVRQVCQALAKKNLAKNTVAGVWQLAF